ncbi:hypothetical protein ACFC08_26705 [Streptomyces sp. NPDC056112]|uniref:hypothetical protein n=1 Tax=unclassified Streptomyces TaxID=2593676 RepID=UPI001CD60C01|nr:MULTISPECIES: hypothetical protein [unclassified Streptomyces]
MPPPPKKRSAGKIVGVGCLGVFALFVVIGIIGAVVGDGDGKSDDTTSSAKSIAPTGTASPKPTAEEKDVKAGDLAGTTTSTLGGNIAPWVDKMTSYGVIWEKQGAKESIAGLPPTRDWFGEAKGATSAPSFVAHAITDTHRGILSLSCNAVGIPKGSSADQVAVFTDCITSAGLDGIDNAKVRTWIQAKLPAMLGKDGMQVEDLDLGEATLSMDTAGDTAAISIEQQY